MKFILKVLICGIGAVSCLYSQINLIKNPSFENVFNIPITMNTTIYNNYLLPNWKCVSITPDLYSTYAQYYLPECYATISYTSGLLSVSIPLNCMGYQFTKDGNFYLGMFTAVKPINSNYPPYYNRSEKIRGETLDTLIRHHVYEFTLYWSFPNGIPYSCNQFQVYFSKDTLFDTLSFPATPYLTSVYLNKFKFYAENDTSIFMNDTLNWVPLKKCFKAIGGEKYIYLGNYRDGTYTKTNPESRDSSFIKYGISYYGSCIEDNPIAFCSYYFIDDLSLYDRGYYGEDARARSDTLICPNVPIVLANNDTSDARYQWFPPAFLNCDTCPNPVASPTITTTYVVKKFLCDYATYDTVTIYVAPTPKPISIINDTNLCYPSSLPLSHSDSSYNFTQYQWSPTDYLSCSNCPDPAFNPPDTGTYHYFFTQTFCNTKLLQDSVTIQVKFCNNNAELETPNIFTPNNDGINDEWFIQ